MKVTVRALLLSSALLVAACGDEDGDGAADNTSTTPSKLAITADWLNNTLSYVDYGALLSGKSTRAEVVTRTIDLGAYPPGAFALELTHDKKHLFVSCSTGFFSIPGSGILINESNVPTGDGTMLIYDVASGELVKQLDTGKGPMGVAVTPDDKRAFVAHFTSGDVAVVDLDTMSVVERAPIGQLPEEIALDDSGAVGLVGYGTAGSVKTFAVGELTSSLTDVDLQGDSAGVAFFPGTKKALIVQAPNPLSPRYGYTLLDVTNPRAPRVLEDVRKDGLEVAYPALQAPDRGTVIVPITRSNKLYIEEYRMNGDKAEIAKSIVVGDGSLLAVMGFAYDGAGNVVAGLVSQRAIMLANLDTGSARTIPWEQMRAGPTDVVIR